MSLEFDKDIKKYFSEFIAEIEREFVSAEKNIRSLFADVYLSARYEDDYTAVKDVGIDLTGYELPKFIQGLLELKTESMVPQSDNVLRVLFKKPNDNKELVREVTYKYSEWRNYVVGQAQPVLNEIILTVNEVLTDFYGKVAEDYLEHLKLLITQQTEIKETVIYDLSDDEQKLQEDNDWFALFEEKLHDIERR